MELRHADPVNVGVHCVVVRAHMLHPGHLGELRRAAGRNGRRARTKTKQLPDEHQDVWAGRASSTFWRRSAPALSARGGPWTASDDHVPPRTVEGCFHWIPLEFIGEGLQRYVNHAH